MGSRIIKEFSDFNNIYISVKISLDRIKILNKIPYKIEIIEKLGFGDESEMRVVEWENVILLEVLIPVDKQVDVAEKKIKLDGSFDISSFQYYEENGELFLSELEIFDWNELW